MFPLPQPELQDFSQASQWMIKTGKSFGPKERHQTLGHDVKKTRDPENMDGQKQVASWEPASL